MSIDELIRGRRTHKAYDARAGRPRDARGAVRARALGAEPQPHEPVALPRARPGGARGAQGRPPGPRRRAKLDRAPTLVAASVRASDGDPVADEEDLARRRGGDATSCCSARTRAGSAATGARPGCCARPRAAPRCGIPDERARARPVHLGRAKGAGQARARARPGRRRPRPTSPDARRAPTPSPRCAAERVRRARDRRRHHRRRRRARRRHARLLGRAGRAGRLRVRHLVAARASSSTAACATCRTSTSGSCARRCSSASSMVALAPHLVRPLPFVVPAFEGARPDRLRRARAEHVRRDGASTGCAAAARGATRDARRTAEDWSPARHRVIDGDEVRRAAARARRRASPTGGYLFYDCQTDDVAARADRARRGRALRRGVRQRARGHRAGRGGRARRAARACATPRRGERVRGRAPTNVVNATGVWADRHPPRASCTTRPRCR